MELKDIEMRPNRKASLKTRSLDEWLGEYVVIDYGMIVLCREGEADLRVNFTEWRLKPGSVITLFPGDVVSITSKSEKFKAETLRYAASLLRLYFEQEGCICLDQLVMLQLKAFFLGFYDYLYRNPSERKAESESPRTKELFNQFMRELERRYRESRDVSYYAELLHISPKYLNMVTQRMTSHTIKTIINQYVVLQIKQSLTTEEKSIKQIAWEYHFSDLSFFCRYFKQHTGMTPQQFRKRELRSPVEGVSAAQL